VEIADQVIVDQVITDMVIADQVTAEHHNTKTQLHQETVLPVLPANAESNH